MFLSDVPSEAVTAQLEAERFTPDRFELVGSELFCTTPMAPAGRR